MHAAGLWSAGACSRFRQKRKGFAYTGIAAQNGENTNKKTCSTGKLSETGQSK
jgi:hypothetical protein